MPICRSYKELIRFKTFEERFEYLKLSGEVGAPTFGSHRYLNQKFYTSSEWRRFRRDIILRDNGCDLAYQDRPINGLVLIHHLNPLSIDEVLNRSEKLMDPDNVVSVCFETHNALHYGDSTLLLSDFVERKPGDTKLW